MRDALNTKRTRRYVIGTVLTGRVVRSAADVATVAAQVAAGSLTTLDGATFGLFDSAAFDDSCSIASGLVALTSPNNPWTAADVGKAIDIQGAGAAGATLRTRIRTYVSAGSVTVWDAASTTVAALVSSAGGLAVWGNDLNLARNLPTQQTESGTSESAKATDTVVSTGSPSGRTLADRFSDVINIKDYGAVGDGTACDSAFTRAIAVLMARTVPGGVIYVPGGTYRINGVVTFRAGITVRGDGLEVTKFDLRAGASLQWYEDSLADINGGGLEGCTVVTTGAVTNAVDVKNVWGFRLLHNRIYSSDNLLAVGLELRDYSFEADVRGCRITDVTANCIKFSTTGAVFANSAVIDNCDLHTEDGGVQILNLGAGGVKIVNNHFERAFISATSQGGPAAIDLNGPCLGTVIANNLITAAYNGAGDAQILVRGGAQSTQIIGNRITITGGSGIVISGSAVGYCSIVGNTFAIDNGVDAIKVAGRFAIAITGNTFRLPDSGTEGLTGACIYLTSSASDIAIAGNCIFGEGAGDMPGAGIMIDDGCTGISIVGGSITNMTKGVDCNSASTTKTVTVSGVAFAGNGTTIEITDLQAITIRDCPGYKNAGHGTATIASGATTGTVAHGLAITPLASNVRCGYYDASTNDPGPVWVASVTATNINFACRADPGATGLLVSWSYQPN